MRVRGALPLLGAMIAGAVPPLAAQRPATQHIVWPAPPEVARIEYVGWLASELDLGRREGFFAKVKRSVFGGAAPRHLAVERPFDLYASADERLYVTDGVTPAVRVFDTQQREARMLGADVPGGLQRPMGLGGDGTGRVYVADPGAARIVVFAPDGSFARVFGSAGVLLNPVDVAVDSVTGRCYVVDAYQHQVVVFDSLGGVVARIGKQSMTIAERAALATASGAVAAHDDSALAAPHAAVPGGLANDPSDLWGNRGGAPGEFRYPVSAAVAPNGNVYVSDQMNFRVQVFDRDGAFVRQIGSIGDQPGSFARPKGVAVDRRGHVYVADAAFNNVQIFDDAGQLLLAFGALGTGEGRHWMPLGVATDDHDRIWVADRYNNRAQIYRYLAASDTGTDPEPADRRTGGQ